MRSEGTSYIYAIYNNKPNALGTQIFAPVTEGGSRYDINYWDYPAGGDAIYELTKSLDNPFGFAISLKNRHP